MSLICRCDIRTGDRPDSHMHGADALISHDHGQTWDIDKRYILDEFGVLQRGELA